MSSFDSQLDASIITEPTHKLQTPVPAPASKTPVSSRSRQRRTGKRSVYLFTSLLLLVIIIYTTLQLTVVTGQSNDQLRVRVGTQQETLVDLRQSVPISPYLTGVNIFPQKNTSSMDTPFSGFMQDTPLINTGLQNMHTRLLRYPGGTWGEQHVLSYNQLADFTSLLNKTHTDGMISVHLGGPIMDGNGIPQPKSINTDLNTRAELAGQWVDYMNNKKSTFRQGDHANDPFHPVKFWSVGNEPDQIINPETQKHYTVEEYTNAFIQFSIKMHQNDPTIKVFGPELSQFYGLGYGPFDANGQVWMENFLKGVAQYEQQHQLNFHLLDGVSFHRYQFNDARQTSSLLLSSSGEWDYLLPPLRELIKHDFNRDIPIAITEVNTNPGNEVPSRGNAALWWADTLGKFMAQHVEYSVFFSATGVDKPYPLFTSDGLHETQMGRVTELFAHQQRNLIPPGEQHETISMYATQDDAHQTVSLLFINKSSETQLAQIQPVNTFFHASPWPMQDVTIAAQSVILLTIHRDGGATAYSYIVPNSLNSDILPLKFTVCGKKADALAHELPC